MTDVLDRIRMDTDCDSSGFEAYTGVDPESLDADTFDDEDIDAKDELFETSGKAALQAQHEIYSETMAREAAYGQQRINDQISRAGSPDGLSDRERAIRNRYPTPTVLGYYVALCSVEDAWEFEVPKEICA